MKQFFNGLLPRVILALVAGILLGGFVPEFVVRVCVTFNGIFSGFLGFSIPLIILGLIVSGIGDMGNRAGKLLILTIAIAYGSTLFSGFLTYFTGKLVLPRIVDPEHALLLSADHSTDSQIAPFFTIEMPPLLDVMSALIIAFILGIGISRIPGTFLRTAFSEFKDVVERLIHSVIIPLLPLFIFGIFLNMSYSGQAFEMMAEFGKVIIFILLLSLVLLLIQFSAAGIISRRNPLRLLKNMIPAYLTALGSASSAATIPVTLAQTQKNGVHTGVAEFCVPLCATIHLAGSTLKITGMSMAILIMQDMPVDFVTYTGFICLLGVTMIAAPGVPGGAVMAAVAILQSVLGFNEQALAVMIAVYVAIDSFGTACNVAGDGAICVAVNQWTNCETVPAPTN
jgi:Na+/H+-dicarboxylate symporter